MNLFLASPLQCCIMTINVLSMAVPLLCTSWQRQKHCTYCAILPSFFHVTLLGPPHLAKAAAVMFETLMYKIVDLSEFGKATCMILFS